MGDLYTHQALAAATKAAENFARLCNVGANLLVDLHVALQEQQEIIRKAREEGRSD